jgi:hypothetical protein
MDFFVLPGLRRTASPVRLLLVILTISHYFVSDEMAGAALYGQRFL